MYTYAFPAYDEGTAGKHGFSGLGAFGATDPPRESLSAWKGRIGYVQWDIKRALAQLSAFPLAYQNVSPFFLMAQSLVNDAANLVKLEESIPQWTRFREAIIDQKLADARAKYDIGVGTAATMGATITHKMSTWVLAAAGSASAGAPAAPGEAPAKDVRPGEAPNFLMRPLVAGIPTWAFLGGAGVLLLATGALRIGR